MEQRWADLDGPVFYEEWPGPAGPRRPTFVCVHGLGGSHANWMRVAGPLSRRGRVLVVDLLGSGRTPRAGRSSGVVANRAMLSRFIREVAGGPVVLCGNSLGASIALLQAAVEPETVAALVLNGAALPPARGKLPSLVVVSGTAVYTLPRAGETLAWLRLKALAPETLIRLGFRIVLGDSSSISPDVVDAHVALVRSMQADPDAVGAFVQTTRSILSLMRRPSEAHRYLDAVTTPVLLMHGARDRVVPMRPTLAAAPSNWDVRVFPELGHVFQLEAPDVWLETTERWLDSLGDGRLRSDGRGPGQARPDGAREDHHPAEQGPGADSLRQ